MSDSGSSVPVLFKERWEIVQDEIRRRILSGEIPPNAPIKEVEIAVSLGVSRGPVREAIRALEISGIVSRRPQRTSIVTPITRADIDEIYSLRAVLEDLAITRSIEAHPVELAADLTQRLAALTGAVAAGADVARIAELDIELHDAFYKWADNRRLEATWNTLRDSLRLFMTFTNSGLSQSSPDAGHRAIVDAAVAGDVELTRSLAQRHLREARSMVPTIPLE